MLDRVPVDAITEQARAAKPGRVLLTVLAGALFGAAWLVAKTWGALWLAVSWCFVAARLGWCEARGNQPSRASLREENDRLRQENKRLGG
jgi:uncharacterized membrane protein YdjX (TVP38/TMEM64 family)